MNVNELISKLLDFTSKFPDYKVNPVMIREHDAKSEMREMDAVMLIRENLVLFPEAKKNADNIES